MATVPAAAQALRILRYLAGQAEPVPAAAIARHLGLPRSTTYHLLDTLRGEGFVTHLDDDRRYGLGVSAFDLASGYSRQAPLARLARVPLAALADRVRHNAHLAVLHGRDVLYVLEERVPGRPPLVTEVGVRLPAHLTASGRALLALLPPEQVRALFPDRGAFVQRTEVGPTSLPALRALLRETRAAGVAAEDGEVTPGFASLGVAIPDHTGHPVAAVAVTFPGADVPTDERELIAEEVRRTARQLGARIHA